MKKNRKIQILMIVIIPIFFTACSGGGYDNCVKEMVDDGYSIEEAQELCHDAETESQIR